jgi:7-keto-8-aminopelargonate synthetase-like enzyme
MEHDPLKNDFDQELAGRLQAIREQGLLRALRRVDSPQGPHISIDGQRLLNFSSNDYLGLANEPALKEAAKKAVDDFGAGSGASRLICGSLAPHHPLEEAIAEFKGAAAALSFSSGYATAIGAIGALLSKEDIIITDKLVHASIVDAARLCGAKRRVFAHNDLNELEDILKSATQRSAGGSPASDLTARPTQRRPQILIVTESVFSMDGDFAALREIVELKEKYGAWLMLDEAHATGLFGQNRRGLAEAFEMAERVEVHMGTLGKAVGAAGGYICGSRPLIDLLINRARSFIFSTAPAPASAAAATAGIRFIQSEAGEARRAQLWAQVDQVKNGLIGGPWKTPLIRSPIIPLILGDEGVALETAARLRSQGVFIPAIRYPSVARGEARLRLTVTAAHSHDDIKAVLQALAQCGPRN